jgi:hypothetical protein
VRSVVHGQGPPGLGPRLADGNVWHQALEMEHRLVKPSGPLPVESAQFVENTRNNPPAKPRTSRPRGGWQNAF